MPGPLSRPRDRRRPAGTSPGAADPSYAYRIGWLKEARVWDERRRAAVAEGLHTVLGASAFSPNEYRRLYRVPALDESLHAGASLLALHQVLLALETDP
jgi:hypothetical protein